jgi:hypothetical protein
MPTPVAPQLQQTKSQNRKLALIRKKPQWTRFAGRNRSPKCLLPSQNQSRKALKIKAKLDNWLCSASFMRQGRPPVGQVSRPARDVHVAPSASEASGQSGSRLVASGSLADRLLTFGQPGATGGKRASRVLPNMPRGWPQHAKTKGQTEEMASFRKIARSNMAGLTRTARRPPSRRLRGGP